MGAFGDPCPDPDGDGNCGYALCPSCHPERWEAGQLKPMHALPLIEEIEARIRPSVASVSAYVRHFKWPRQKRHGSVDIGTIWPSRFEPDAVVWQQKNGKWRGTTKRLKLRGPDLDWILMMLYLEHLNPAGATGVVKT